MDDRSYRNHLVYYAVYRRFIWLCVAPALPIAAADRDLTVLDLDRLTRYYTSCIRSRMARKGASRRDRQCVEQDATLDCATLIASLSAASTVCAAKRPDRSDRRDLRHLPD